MVVDLEKAHDILAEMLEEYINKQNSMTYYKLEDYAGFGNDFILFIKGGGREYKLKLKITDIFEIKEV